MATRQSARSRAGAPGSDDGAVDPALPQKKRARHRLVGALVLCGLAAVVVPLLLDSEPTRPVSDVPIVIPSRDTPLPARAPEASGARAGEAARTAGVAPGGSAAASAGPAGAAAGGSGASGAVARGTIEPAPRADAASGDAKSGDAKSGDAKSGASKGADGKGADGKAGDGKGAEARAAAPRAADKASDPAKGAGEPKAAQGDARKDEIQQLAEARLKGETAGRYLLQVGAFSGESGANTAVGKVTATGLRAYTERVKTERGERIRVRVGPFPSREAAERARERLKSAGIETAMIAP